MSLVSFVVNGRRVRVRTHPLKRLLDVLREDCALTGTKEGCGEGECGACTVLIDGVPANDPVPLFGMSPGHPPKEYGTSREIHDLALVDQVEAETLR